MFSVKLHFCHNTELNQLIPAYRVCNRHIKVSLKVLGSATIMFNIRYIILLFKISKLSCLMAALVHLEVFEIQYCSSFHYITLPSCVIPQQDGPRVSMFSLCLCGVPQGAPFPPIVQRFEGHVNGKCKLQV